MKKVLMIATCNFLTNHNDGGRQCSYRNYKLLCEIFGADNVQVCMIANDAVEKADNVSLFPSYTGRVQQIWWALLLRNGYSLRTQRQIIQMAEQTDYSYIWFDRSTLGRLCAKIHTKAKKIIFFHNVEKEYIKNKISHENAGYLISYPAFAVNEQKAVQKADKVICLNERDSMLLNDIYGRKADLLLPISFDDAYDGKSNMTNRENETKELLFVGSYFQPNVEGLDWFVHNVMSQLQDVHLTIVGKGMEKKADCWNGENVHVVGTVQELSEYYLRADAVVLPIFYGDGMKVKTAEALMYGKAVFGSKEAFEGYEIANAPDIVECNTAKEYVDRINSFFHEKRSCYFSETNRKLFLDKYENRSMIKKLEEFLNN